MTHATDPMLLVRRALRTILVFGMVGTAVELLLLGHTEDVWQLVPLVVIPLGLLALTWRVLADGPVSRWTVRTVMLATVATGVLGTWQHYSGNAQFEVEMAPDVAGWPLFAEAMTGATPALAPGAMVLLGLIGLVSEAGRDRPRAGETSN